MKGLALEANLRREVYRRLKLFLQGNIKVMFHHGVNDSKVIDITSVVICIDDLSQYVNHIYASYVGPHSRSQTLKIS